MANPGVFFPYVSDAMWPFLAIVGVVVSVPLLGFAILMTIAEPSLRMRAVAAAVFTLALTTVSVWGLLRADSDFREAEIAHRAAYVERVGGWLEQAYGMKLADAELSGVLTPDGISGQFDGAATFIVVRGDIDTGRLVVTDRNGAEILPIQ